MLRTGRSYAVILLSMLGLLAVALPAASAQSEQNRVIVNQVGLAGQSTIVNAYVSVLSPDGSSADLDAGAFTVLEDNSPVAAEVTTERVGLAVMIMVDLSGSMKEPGVVEGQDRLQSAKEIVEPFIVDTLHPEDWVGVMGFDTEVVYAQPLTQDHGAARNTVIQMAYDPHGNTALLNTASSALDQLQAGAPEPMRKLLLIISDGKDFLERSDAVAYQESREALARKAKEYGVPIYTVGIDSYCAQGGLGSCIGYPQENTYESQDVAWLAAQTGGGYVHYGGQDADSEGKAAVRKLLSAIVGQGEQYRVSYASHAAKGQHELEIQVTSRGSTSAVKTTFYSPFELPEVRITDPTEGYSLDLQEGSTIHVEAAVSFPDDRPRSVEKVVIYDGSSVIATLTEEPYAFDWDVSNNSGDRTLRAEATDTIIRDRLAISEAVVVTVIPLPPTPVPLIPTPVPGEEATWIVRQTMQWLPVLLVVAVGFVFVLFIGLRRQIATGIKKTTTWVKKQTAVLAPTPRGGVLAKLIGPGGSQYTISGRHVSFGSEAELSDQVIPYDKYISGKHFSIVKETDAFYITDEQSRNGTQVNGQPIAAGQRIPLADGFEIVAGQTRLQFRVGSVTMPLS